jgi:hypothetical protein
MFIEQLWYFVGWTALFGLSFVRLAHPTARATKGMINTVYIWQEPRKFVFWLVLFLLTMFFWALSGLQVAGVL